MSKFSRADWKALYAIRKMVAGKNPPALFTSVRTSIRGMRKINLIPHGRPGIRYIPSDEMGMQHIKERYPINASIYLTKVERYIHVKRGKPNWNHNPLKDNTHRGIITVSLLWDRKVAKNHIARVGYLFTLTATQINTNIPDIKVFKAKVCFLSAPDTIEGYISQINFRYEIKNHFARTLEKAIQKANLSLKRKVTKLISPKENQNG